MLYNVIILSLIIILTNIYLLSIYWDTPLCNSIFIIFTFSLRYLGTHALSLMREARRTQFLKYITSASHVYIQTRESNNIDSLSFLVAYFPSIHYRHGFKRRVAGKHTSQYLISRYNFPRDKENTEYIWVFTMRNIFEHIFHRIL